MDKQNIPVDDLQKARETQQEKILRAELKKFGLGFVAKRKERRHILKLYNDIVSAIKDESANGPVKPTRIQFLSNMSYDNCIKHLDKLEKIGLIKQDPIIVTEKGRAFLTDYEKICSYLGRL